jgi:hypothetical protein
MVGPIFYFFKSFFSNYDKCSNQCFFSQICEGGWLAKNCECLYVKVSLVFSFLFWGGGGGVGIDGSN